VRVDFLSLSGDFLAGIVALELSRVQGCQLGPNG